MEFSVDSTLVNSEVKDSVLHIAYKVPSEWTAVPTNDSSLSHLNAGGIRLSNLLKNAAGTVVFSVSDVREVADSIFRNMDANPPRRKFPRKFSFPWSEYAPFLKWPSSRFRFRLPLETAMIPALATSLKTRALKTLPIRQPSFF